MNQGAHGDKELSRRQVEQFGAGLEAHSPEVLQCRPVSNLNIRRPQERKGRRWPEPDDLGANLEDIGLAEGADLYCEMTDDKGREYTLLLCTGRDCLIASGDGQ